MKQALSCTLTGLKTSWGSRCILVWKLRFTTFEVWTQLLSGVWKPRLTASGALNPACLKCVPGVCGWCVGFQATTVFLSLKILLILHLYAVHTAQAPKEAAYALGFILGPRNSCLVGLACTFIIWALEAHTSWLVECAVHRLSYSGLWKLILLCLLEKYELSSFGPWKLILLG
jgi:hypothetical protein